MAMLCLEQVLHGKVCTSEMMATLLKEAEYMMLFSRQHQGYWISIFQHYFSLQEQRH
jgi:hypothetical protein